jgi:hypothetical protein
MISGGAGRDGEAIGSMPVVLPSVNSGAAAGAGIAGGALIAAALSGLRASRN